MQGVRLFFLCLVSCAVAQFCSAGTSLSNLTALSTFSYSPVTTSNASAGCQFASQACGSISGVASVSFDSQSVYVVGVVNGLDVLRVQSGSSEAQRVQWFSSCLNKWRSVAAGNSNSKVIYSVSERTSTCVCPVGTTECAQQLRVDMNGKSVLYTITQGPGVAPISSLASAIQGPLVVVNPWDSGACGGQIQDAANFTNAIALVWSGGPCFLEDKARALQQLGALAVVLVNSAGDFVSPGLSVDYANITIPTVLLSNQDGMSLKAAVDVGARPLVVIDPKARAANAAFSSPEGLVAVDVSVPEKPVVRKFSNVFSNARSVFMESGRPYVYVAGASLVDGIDKYSVVPNGGGVLVFSVSDPSNPVLAGQYGGADFHHMVVKTCGPRVIMVASSFSEGLVYLLDVSNVGAITLLQKFSAFYPYPLAVTMDDSCSAVFVSHRVFRAPVTVWQFALSGGQQDFQNRPVYAGSLSIGSYTTTSFCHSLALNGTMLAASFFSAGTAVFDISNPVVPVLAGTYTSSNNNVASKSGLQGSFAVTWSPSSAVVAATDTERGIWFLQVQPQTPQADGAMIAMTMLLSLAVLVCIVLAIRMAKLAHIIEN